MANWNNNNNNGGYNNNGGNGYNNGNNNGGYANNGGNGGYNNGNNGGYNNGGNGNNNGGTQDFNVCTNWGLRCYEQKVTDNAVILKCSMNRKKKDTGEYSAPVFIDVVCSFNTCEIAQDDYAKSFINVDGRFSVDDFVNRNGDKIATMTIFAKRVVKSLPAQR